jgi:bifunctional DNA-binding transcriptional regulator/antitoxin component of YhaV-PrlF toxin-antitoxin module
MTIIIEKERKITIPSEYAESLRLYEGDEVDIYKLENTLVIKRRTPSCVFCNAAGNLVRMGRLYACRCCIERLNNAKIGDYLFDTWRN